MRARVIVAGLAVALTACGAPERKDADLDRLDHELAEVNTTSPAADPVLRSALRDQIMVDPALTRMANADAVRPPPQPLSGAVPPDEPASGKPAEAERLRSAPAPGACAQCAAARRVLSAGNCAAQVGYSAAWANRLPAGAPLYPDAAVKEAAGVDAPSCRFRVVSFVSGAPLQRVVDWYYTRAAAAGYAAEHGAGGGEHTLGGTKPGAAFLVTLKPAANGGTSVDLMADGG